MKHVSVREAREILGNVASELNDDQIQELLNHLVEIAKLYLEDAQSKKVMECQINR